MLRDIYPEELRADIDALNVIIYADFNLAVNLAALVTNQKDYEYYYDRIFARLDWLEERLSKQRYLMGDTITDPDIRIFPTLLALTSYSTKNTWLIKNAS